MFTIKIKMPYGAAYIIEELNKNGYEAYIVGGCVRDCVLGKEPNDWDITTNAKPEQVKKIFKRTVDTGIEHGTVTVLIYNNTAKETDIATEFVADRKGILETYEVTTYRIDGEYEDHRRPKDVLFTSKLEEDLKRRDFTINAMAYNDEHGIVDIFGGQKDLENKVIRCVGNPDERFDEDALRILRAVRFSAQLGFDIEEATEASAKAHAGDLERISAERIQVELTKLITSPNPDRIAKAYELGITKVILPEFDAMMQTTQNNPYHVYNVGVHTIKVMEHIMPEMILRYTALLHDAGKVECKKTGTDGIDHFYGHPEKSAEIARTVLRRLKLDNNTVKITCALVKYHDYGIGNSLSEKSFRRFLAALGKENFKSFIAIKKADLAGQSSYRMEERLEQVRRLEALYKKVIEEEQCIYIKDLKVNGKDLIALGVKPGKGLGEILNRLLAEVIDEPQKNNREYLLKRAYELTS